MLNAQCSMWICFLAFAKGSLVSSLQSPVSSLQFPVGSFQFAIGSSFPIFDFENSFFTRRPQPVRAEVRSASVASPTLPARRSFGEGGRRSTLHAKKSRDTAIKHNKLTRPGRVPSFVPVGSLQSPVGSPQSLILKSKLAFFTR